MLEAVGKYSFVNAKIRARLSSLMTREALMKLLDARDLADFFAGLAGTPYEAIFAKPEAAADPKLAERLLVEEEVQWHADIVKALKEPERSLVATMLERYELENLKVALRVREGDRDKGDLAYVVRKPLPHKLRLEEIATARSLEEVFPYLANTPYLVPLRKSLDECKEKGTLFPAEIALELDFYRRIEERIKALSRADRAIARKLIGIEIDLRNIGWLMRLKFYYGVPSTELIDYLIPGGYRLTSYQLRRAFVPDSVKDVLTVLSLIILEREFGLAADLLRNEDEIGKLYFIEIILSKYMLIEIRKILEGYPFTIGTVLGYLVLKRAEVQNLTTILNGKLLSLDKPDIEKHLRSAY
jgi:V/A-type H+/Na+-transporting ATPase subunit C